VSGEGRRKELEGAKGAGTEEEEARFRHRGKGKGGWVVAQEE
jgi:hypothetical protein